MNRKSVVGIAVLLLLFSILALVSLQGVLSAALFLSAIIALISAAFFMSSPKKEAPPVERPTRKETTIIQREIVKIPCKYCGTLNDLATARFCVGCGAPIK